MRIKNSSLVGKLCFKKALFLATHYTRKKMTNEIVSDTHTYTHTERHSNTHTDIYTHTLKQTYTKTNRDTNAYTRHTHILTNIHTHSFQPTSAPSIYTHHKPDIVVTC